MVDFKLLAEKHGVSELYAHYTDIEKSGNGNGFRINLETALTETELGHGSIDKNIKHFVTGGWRSNMAC